MTLIKDPKNNTDLSLIVISVNYIFLDFLTLKPFLNRYFKSFPLKNVKFGNFRFFEKIDYLPF